eukprot:3960556-Lingulodinium_polyedra.AAC.1
MAIFRAQNAGKTQRHATVASGQRVAFAAVWPSFHGAVACGRAPARHCLFEGAPQVHWCFRHSGPAQAWPAP